ncbi:MAG: cysteine--tRNA ligase [Elusimicrobiota bacterium]|nr:cysteine--tRNA ligase [Elusimicrobiota bacterium]
MLKLYNTLSHRKEEFIPTEPNRVKMYVCGITPYDECHLGHARCYVMFDTIRRYLEFLGYKVEYVQNFTDIDDKIILRSKQLAVSSMQLAEKYINEYFEHCKKLNIKPADVYPKVTEHIKEITEAIEKLIDRGYAYVSDRSVYFKVKKFKSYGKLSKRNYDELLVGVRIEPDEKKLDPLDFALWKKAKPDETEEVKFSSPWGSGRPGWHIECSVMSLHELNTETIDIHGGGNDLIFPHHENEIAQSEALTGKQFVKYWIHNGFVTVNREKMSKSLGNFFSLKEIFEKFPPEVVRLFLLSQHYRKPLDFSDDKLQQCKNSYEHMVNVYEFAIFVFRKKFSREPLTVDNLDTVTQAEFEIAMNNDFNTAEALACLQKLINRINEKIYSDDVVQDELSRQIFTLKFFMEDILGINLVREGLDESIRENVYNLLVQREIARKDKDWQKADQLRKEIFSHGYLIEDTPYGTKLKRR